jgi:hypothetical protein
MKSQGTSSIDIAKLSRIFGLVACVAALALLYAASGWSSRNGGRMPFSFVRFSNEESAVPEPSSALMIAAGAAALVRWRRQRMSG